jgi:hypothetical protein
VPFLEHPASLSALTGKPEGYQFQMPDRKKSNRDTNLKNMKRKII